MKQLILPDSFILFCGSIFGKNMTWHFLYSIMMYSKIWAFGLWLYLKRNPQVGFAPPPPQRVFGWCTRTQKHGSLCILAFILPAQPQTIRLEDKDRHHMSNLFHPEPGDAEYNSRIVEVWKGLKWTETEQCTSFLSTALSECIQKWPLPQSSTHLHHLFNLLHPRKWFLPQPLYNSAPSINKTLLPQKTTWGWPLWWCSAQQRKRFLATLAECHELGWSWTARPGFLDLEFCGWLRWCRVWCTSHTVASELGRSPLFGCRNS